MGSSPCVFLPGLLGTMLGRGGSTGAMQCDGGLLLLSTQSATGSGGSGVMMTAGHRGRRGTGDRRPQRP
jgi:hypothetical protein